MVPRKAEQEKGSSVQDKSVQDRKKPKSRSKTPLAQRRKARSLIVQALYQWHVAKSEPLDIEIQFHEQNGGKIDWEYFSEVFLEIPKQQKTLDETLLPLLDRKLEALDPVERALLYLGTFELANRIDIPYSVVINECVELAKTFGATDGHKYINGVLDKLAVTLRPVELSAKQAARNKSHR